MAWYTIQTSPNCEGKVIEGIKKLIEKNNLAISEIFSPEETIVEYKMGQKKERKKRLYSNYIFIEMDYNENVWHFFNGIKGFIGFVGNKLSPAKISEKEIMAIKNEVETSGVKHKIMFEIGSNVRIVEGSFVDFIGIVRLVDQKRNKAKVGITIFNRESEVDVDLKSIKLVSE